MRTDFWFIEQYLLNSSLFCDLEDWAGNSISACADWSEQSFIEFSHKTNRLSLMFRGDGIIPTRGSNILVGNEACRVSHWSGGFEG